MNRYVLPSLLVGSVLIAAGCGDTEESRTSQDDSATAATGTPAAATIESPEPAAAPAAAKAKQPEAAMDDPQGGTMPREFKGLQELLAKASPDKEPKNPQLNQFSNPSRGLRWLARYDSNKQVRRFSLHALGLYPTPENSAVLLAVASNKKDDAEVRAAALRGMGRYDLEQEVMTALKEGVLEAANSKDVTVAAGAVDAMHGMVTALSILEDMAANPKLAPEVRSAAKRALGPQLDNDDLSGPGD